jgi:hypothetical protein
MSDGNGKAPSVFAVGEEPPPLRTAQTSESRRTPKAGSAKGKAGTRFAVLNGFVDFTLAKLNRSDIAVWLVLYRDTRDGSARTGLMDLARRAGCDRSTAFRAVHRLERLGLLQVVHRGSLGKGPSRYRVQPFCKEA